ncbi:maleylpyruvate isomerase family mycothiol-dependent enzyme [Pseudonocardia kunmingensis]|uniref:Uncharacterized protein (TIGR03083 family) n=1 Tax=Pseudonocardia kunmingensis TaxID=630975 RepID=A0A543DII4_9PSEU|nr:maleylpyruvate isomerase family mycothiol-dependent enzyme [Pseudonocardia kunmingensis]TQM09133.1 uncharacterized protein (TIGR03083 family) [Pseudonocardia kunmingensis]
MEIAREFVDQNRLLGEVLRRADADTPVPTCPGWTLRQLLTHVGRGDRWAAMIVRERADARVDLRSVPDGKPPAEIDAAVSWLTESAALLLEAVAATGADVPVWTFTGPQPAAWWVRRRLHESVVHRADAAIALGAPYEVDPALAADGLSEWLDLLGARAEPEEGPALPDGVALHLHATDDGLGAAGEWLVRGEAGRVRWEHGHGKGAVAVRGSAAVLLQAVLRRIPADDARLAVLGDQGAWRTWLERTPF